MPLYEYVCRSCGARFERLRPMSRASEPVACPAGHPKAERTLSLFATHTRQQDGSTAPLGSGGGCPGCAGGACACGAS